MGYLFFANMSYTYRILIPLIWYHLISNTFSLIYKVNWTDSRPKKKKKTLLTMRRRFAARAYHFVNLKYLGASTHVNFSVSLITLQHKITSMFHLYIIFHHFVIVFFFFLLNFTIFIFIRVGFYLFLTLLVFLA